MRFLPPLLHGPKYGRYGLVFLLLGLSGCDLFCLSDCRDSKATDALADVKSEHHDHSQHHHNLLEVTSFGESVAIPFVDFSIQPDDVSGWNIRIKTKNFIFTPENINSESKSNEGHGHIYVDNFKMARIYSNWYHLKKLTPGKHSVRISLNSNDHSEWAHGGAPIDSTKIVIQN